MRRAVLAALWLSAGAMGCDGANGAFEFDPAPAARVFDDHAAGAAGDTRVCPKYPVPFDTEGGEDQARVDLSALAPNALLDWSTPRGTPARVDDLDLPLECAPGRDVFAAAVDLFASRPALFHLAADEWTPTAWLPCELVGESPVFLILARERIAGMPAGRDLLTFIVSRVDGVVSLRTVVGIYLGEPQPHTQTNMRSCHSMADVAGVVERQSFAFDRFHQCQPAGSSSYSPQPGDVISTDAEPVWRWFTHGGVVSLRAVRRARIEVGPENITDELLSSTAACPKPDGSYSVGFQVDVDDVTGEILSAQPGLSCIVCAR